MLTYFVIESICEISKINQPDDPERISWQKTNDNRYMVDSNKIFGTRYLTVYSQAEDAKKQFGECIKKLSEELPRYESFNLMEVSALTRRGAAKKAFLKKGNVLKTALIDKEAWKRKKKEEAVGDLLLSAFERGASKDELSRTNELANKQ